jgi:hypothetical protein
MSVSSDVNMSILRDALLPNSPSLIGRHLVFWWSRVY